MLESNCKPIELSYTLSNSQIFKNLLDIPLNIPQPHPHPRAVGVKTVYYNDRHTTIVWSDGVKTTVGCMEGEPFDEYAGFAAAIVKRMFGSSREAKRFLDKHKIVQRVKPKKVKTEDQPKLEDATTPLMLGSPEVSGGEQAGQVEGQVEGQVKGQVEGQVEGQGNA